MELWSLYESIGFATGFFGDVQPDDQKYGNLLLIMAIVSAVVWLVFFVLQGVALYTMAKKRGIKRSALAFVPFANILLMGKLAGETTFFGQRIKRAGLYAMIAQIIVTLVACSYIAADVYLHQSGCIRYEAAGDALEQLRAHWNDGTRFQRFLYDYYYDVAYFLNMIFGLLCEILMLMILLSLFRKYNPEGYIWMTVIVLFVPIARSIILFIFRNRKAVDYGAYMQAKRDAYIRRYQQHYGQNGGYNPYGGYGQQGYGPQGYNRSGYTPSGAQQQTPREEPFSEFSSDKKPEDPFAEFSSDKTKTGGGDSDGFFH